MSENQGTEQPTATVSADANEGTASATVAAPQESSTEDNSPDEASTEDKG